MKLNTNKNVGIIKLNKYNKFERQDELSDWDIYKNNGVLDYLLELKKSGGVRHIGLSSHTPEVIQKILDDADVDMLMFSINPAYDYHEGAYAIGSVDERRGKFVI